MIRPKVWMFLVIIALVALPLGVLGVANNHRYKAEQDVIRSLRQMGARIELEPGRFNPFFGCRLLIVVGVEAHGREFSWQGLSLLCRLPDLRSLSLLGTPTTDDDLEYIELMRGLKVIYLEETEVTDAGLDHFARMSSLSELRVAGGRITEAGLSRLRRSSPKLKVVQGAFL